MSDLMPCPFCGSGPAQTIGNGSFSGVELMGGGTDRPYVWCGTCGSAGSFEDTDAGAIGAWNRRTVQAQIDAAVAAERERIATMIEATSYTNNGAVRSLEPVSPAFVGMDMHHATIAAAIRKGEQP